MKSIIDKCEIKDLEYISGVLDSYVSFTDDKKRKDLLNKSVSCEPSREKLTTIIEKQIKYYGSADFAYLKRYLFNSDGGINSLEVIEDVCKKLNVKIKKGGSIEARLERLVNNVVEKDLVNKSPEELAKAFENIGVGDADIDQVLEHIKKNGKVAVLPILVQVLGPKITLGIIETIIVSLITQIIGREASKQLVKELMKRNPWINSLGPILWVISGVWLAIDLQGPAYRKTIPISLYLGVVGLRDGEEDLK